MASSNGYLPPGVSRRLNTDGTWSFSDAQGQEDKTIDRPYDSDHIFQDRSKFKDEEATVQIVIFSRISGRRPDWCPQLKTAAEVREALRERLPEGSWRWVHCQGMHGPIVRAIAEGTGWDVRKFGGIFTWTRPSMELVNNQLLLHLLNQGSEVYTWQRAGNNDRALDTFISCVRVHPQTQSDFTRRLFDFVDHGCSRPEVKLHRDPSLLYYGLVRAVIQDLRFVALEIHRRMENTYQHVVAHPSSLNLSSLHRDQNTLIGIGLDTTSLLLAAANLCAVADSMHPEPPASDGQAAVPQTPPTASPMISKETRARLNDQMGLIKLLHEELPYISTRADALVHWAFDMLAFQNNNLLQLLAVATLASIPISVATGILGINYFDSSRINGRQISAVLGIVGGIVAIVLFGFTLNFWFQHRDRKRAISVKNVVHRQTETEIRDWASAEDRERNMEISRANSFDAGIRQQLRSATWPPLNVLLGLPFKEPMRTAL